MAIPRIRTLQDLLSSIGAGAAPVYSGNVNAAGMPPTQRARPAWAEEMYNANPPPVDYGSPEYSALPSSERPTFFGTQNIYVPPTGTTGQTQAEAQDGELAMQMDNAATEEWWAKQPKPAGTPADWIYIGMGDWGPPSVYGSGGTDPRPTPSTQHLFPGILGGMMPELTEAEIAAAYGSTTSPSAVQVGLPSIPPSDAS